MSSICDKSRHAFCLVHLCPVYGGDASSPIPALPFIIPPFFSSAFPPSFRPARNVKTPCSFVFLNLCPSKIAHCQSSRSCWCYFAVNHSTSSSTVPSNYQLPRRSCPPSPVIFFNVEELKVLVQAMHPVALLHRSVHVFFVQRSPKRASEVGHFSRAQRILRREVSACTRWPRSSRCSRS